MRRSGVLALYALLGLVYGSMLVEDNENHWSERSNVKSGQSIGEAIYAVHESTSTTNPNTKSTEFSRVVTAIATISSLPLLRPSPGSHHYLYCSVCNADISEATHIHLQERQHITTITNTDATTTQIKMFEDTSGMNPLAFLTITDPNEDPNSLLSSVRSASSLSEYLITCSTSCTAYAESTESKPPPTKPTSTGSDNIPIISTTSPTLTDTMPDSTTSTSSWSPTPWSYTFSDSFSTTTSTTHFPYESGWLGYNTSWSTVVVQTTVTVGANRNATAKNESGGREGAGKGIAGLVLAMLGLIGFL
jgi:hypothetical protein